MTPSCRCRAVTGARVYISCSSSLTVGICSLLVASLKASQAWNPFLYICCCQKNKWRENEASLEGICHIICFKPSTIGLLARTTKENVNHLCAAARGALHEWQIKEVQFEGHFEIRSKIWRERVSGISWTFLLALRFWISNVSTRTERSMWQEVLT